MGTGQRGRFLHPGVPYVGYSTVGTPFGTLTRPGGRVVYVGSGVTEGDPWGIKKKLVPTLNAALSQCRANMCDTVFILPGHTENVATADSWSNLVAGTQIIGLGTGTDRPTFTWTTAASTVLINVANVTIQNCVLEMAGPAGTTALTVAAAMTVSAASFALLNCTVHTEIDADQAATVGIVSTAAADDMLIAGCYFYGSGDGTLPATMIRLVGADRFKMFDCIMDGYPSSVDMGLLQMLTTASLQTHFERCTFTHRLAASVSCVVGKADSTGSVIDCNFMKFADDDLTLAKAWLNSDAMQFAGARICNLAAEHAGIATTVST